MRKDDQKKISSSNNKQNKLKNAVDSPGDQQNQNHNVKKEALGPNTRR